MTHIDTMKMALEALVHIDTADDDRDFLAKPEFEFLHDAMRNLRLAIEQAEKQESVVHQFVGWSASRGYDTAHTYDTERSKWVFFHSMTAELWSAWQTALWFAKQASPPPRQPLTEEEIGALGQESEKFDKRGHEWFDRWTFARAIERAHGIGDEA